MNKLTITFLFVFIFSNSLIAQLVVGENASVTVAESASITVAGLEINPKWNGQSLLNPNCPIKLSGKSSPNNQVQTATRIGISKGQNLQWRFYI